MNILFIATFPIIPHEGGVQRVTDTLSREFLKRGHQVTYLCYSRKHKLSYPNFLCDQLYIELSGQTDLEVQEQLRQYVVQYKISHVINQICDESSNRIVRLLPDFIRDKVIYTYHIIPFSCLSITRKRIWNSPVYNFRQLIFKNASLICPSIYKNFFSRIEKKNILDGMKLATKFCLISHKFVPDILRVIPDISLDKMVAINNPNTYPAQVDLPDFQVREKSVLWVGRVENTQKNLVGFINMWSLFSQNHPDWNTYIVGDGDDFEYFKAYVSKKNIRNLHFEGAQQDVMPYYKKCRFIAVTSFGESWGMILTEAMTCGCIPIVMNTFATLTDIVDDRINGLISDFDDKQMANLLATAAADVELCKSLSKNAVEKAEKFDVKVIADSWISLLQSL